MMVIAANLIWLILPPFGFLFSVLGLWKNPTRWRRYIPILVYILFIGAYVYEPPTYTTNFDLTRYLPDIEAFGKLSLAEAFQKYSDVLYARDILFWLFGRLQIPHMVPGITTAVVYAIAFYITCDTAERYKAERYIGIIILLQITMLPYINIVNNVRNVFGFSLVILGAYLDIIKGKRNITVLFCYAFGSLMHLSAIIFVIFRLVCRPMKKLFAFVLVFPVAFSSIIMLLYNNRGLINIGGNLGSTINLAILKLYWYMTDTTTSYAVLSLNSITVKIDRIIMAVGMVVSLILIYYCLQSNRQIITNRDSKLMTFAGLTASLTLASNVFAMPNFWRFSAAFYVMIGALLVPYLSMKKSIPALLQLLTWVYALLGLMNFAMQVWKCTWFDFFDWIVTFFTTNIITIAIDVIKGIISI